MSKARKLSQEEFRTIQLLELDMLEEMDRVCRKHDIKYCISYGTLLGAVRHKGYIPWDDDADIAMLREEYEKFRKVADELDPSICYFQDHFNDPEYLWQHGKLRRTGTTFVRAGQEHMKGKTGVFVDIFIMDDCPESLSGMILQNIWCFFLRKILYARVGKVNAKGLSKLCYKCLDLISVDWVYKQVDKMSKKSSNNTPNRVRSLLYPLFDTMKNYHHGKDHFGIPKSWFLERAEYDFEGYKFYGTKDYDAFLTFFYYDYMTPPPVEKRYPHATVSSFSFNVDSKNVREKLHAGRII